MNEATKRTIVKEIDAILYEEHKVLDHGFIRVVDYMGSDSAIVQAARVSYGKGTKQISQDEALIKYLMRHHHTTPFEMCEIKFHVKLPIFVARQWIRHRTANVNEYSARYSILDNEFYTPKPEQVAKQSDNNKQGSGEAFDPDTSKEIIDSLINDSNLVYSHYEKFIEQGLAREIARTNLMLNYYTQFYWKIDLHNLLHFLKLRADKHAQYEIRVYAEVMLDIIKKWVPLAYNAFVEYCLESACISRTGLEIIRKLIKGENVTREESNIGKREWGELMSILDKQS
ncbi:MULTISPECIES: FAD-dependent thymidylate synthase [Wolbachia]|jgi:thymidylate synthase (FAD)|uniref:Flavin-dependent thymidylate synthase n=1 Tax=Wolbachia pipientis wMel TaxID=163164 RepID=THYX_WOLPM|nr:MULTISPECIES: FAD-dependent thymidylate synthase [Wolbachia]Q73FX5.1 RecName: Full=Flavin-dependent thymidylate synthase; Short=FDTS; AltName: Full=FAD-dependent thymidylate synthase; AltName: Full=Thymidylate synthase ThyX; Short=TS; Short=TSase [Wolbachia endosymbiont of Drosophila melanogaster]MDU8940588.1 FAD-dependent thymidylate synthase [Wolbachia endosymbiont of Drosophila malagassya]MDX5496368.1 FAD-dependent thymidylate synthase [Wolbachia endosymbiont of Nomada fabriciana]MDX55080